MTVAVTMKKMTILAGNELKIDSKLRQTEEATVLLDRLVTGDDPADSTDAKWPKKSSGGSNRLVL